MKRRSSGRYQRSVSACEEVHELTLLRRPRRSCVPNGQAMRGRARDDQSAQVHLANDCRLIRCAGESDAVSPERSRQWRHVTEVRAVRATSALRQAYDLRAAANSLRFCVALSELFLSLSLDYERLSSSAISGC